MPNEGVSQRLINYLSTPIPKYAFLLQGDWGAGKTYFWQQFCSTRLSALDMRDITFSVAGLTALEELDQAMLLASIEFTPLGPVREAGTVAAKALLRWAKIDPSDIKLKAAVVPGKTIVCIDDVERFNGDFSILFGFVISLLDAESLHVVLIADEQKTTAGFPKYGDYRERIISMSAMVLPEIDAFYSDIVNGFTNQSTREALVDIKVHAVALFMEKGLRNLRTVRGILDELNIIMSAITWPKGQIASLGALLSAVTFHVMAMSKSTASRESLAGIFARGGARVLFSGSSRRDARHEDNSGIGSETSPTNLVREMGFVGDAVQWNGSQAYANYVSSGDLDAERVCEDFNVFVNIMPGPSSPLEQLKHYRNMEEQEFRQCVADLQRQVQSKDFKHLQNVWDAYEILNHLSERRLIAESPEHWKDTFVRLAMDFDESNGISDSLNLWGESLNENQSAVLSALKELQRRISVARAREENVAIRRALIDGNSEILVEPYHALFVSAEPEEIYGALRAAGRKGVNRLVRFYYGRLNINNIGDFTRDEAPFASQLADLIDGCTPNAQPMSLDDAEWHALSDALRLFVAKVNS